jgi:hypothetical protein
MNGQMTNQNANGWSKDPTGLIVRRSRGRTLPQKLQTEMLGGLQVIRDPDYRRKRRERYSYARSCVSCFRKPRRQKTAFDLR